MSRFDREVRWTHSYLAAAGWRVFEGEDPPKGWFFGDGEVRVYLDARVNTSVRLGYCGGTPTFLLGWPRAGWVVHQVALTLLQEAGEDVSRAITGRQLRDRAWCGGLPTIDAGAVAGALGLEAPPGVYGLDYLRRFRDYPGWTEPVVDGRPGTAPVIRVKPSGRRVAIGPILDAYTTMAKWVCSRVSTPADYLAVLRASAAGAAAGDPPEILRARSLKKIVWCDLGTSFLLGVLDEWLGMAATWNGAADALGIPRPSSVPLPLNFTFGEKRLPRLYGIITLENVAARMQRILDEDGVESLGHPPGALV